MNPKTLSLLGVSVLVSSVGSVLATRAYADGPPRPSYQTFAKPRQVRKWQQFCRKTTDFDLGRGMDALNYFMRERGEEGWEVAFLTPPEGPAGVVCFKRPGD